MLTDEARAALIALRDLKVVRAHWTHPGFRQLRERRLVSSKFRQGDELATHRLTDRGRQWIAAFYQ